MGTKEGFYGMVLMSAVLIVTLWMTLVSVKGCRQDKYQHELDKLRIQWQADSLKHCMSK